MFDKETRDVVEPGSENESAQLGKTDPGGELEAESVPDREADLDTATEGFARVGRASAGAPAANSPVGSVFIASALSLSALVLAMAALGSIFSPVLVALAPVPVLIVARRHGAAWAGAVVAICVAAISALGGPIDASPLALLLGIGIAQEIGIRRGWSAGGLIAVSVAMIAAAAGLSVLLQYQEGRQWLLETQREMRQFLDLEKQLFVKLGRKEAGAEIEKMRVFVRYLPYVLPALGALTAMLIASLNYYFSSRATRAFRVEMPRLRPFVLWEVPWYFSWGYILGLIGVLFYQRFGGYALRAELIGADLIGVFSVFFLLQGLAILFFYFKKYRVRVVWQAFVASVIIMVLPLLQGLIFLGLLDTWFNYRRIPDEGTPEALEG